MTDPARTKNALSDETIEKLAQYIIYSDSQEGGKTPRSSSDARRQIHEMGNLLENSNLMCAKSAVLAHEFVNIIKNADEQQDMAFSTVALRAVVAHQADGALAGQMHDALQAMDQKFDAMRCGPLYRQTMHELSAKAADPAHLDMQSGFHGMRAKTVQPVG